MSAIVPQHELLDAARMWAQRQPVSVEAWDAEGRALFVNAAWRNLWQMPDQVLVGASYSILDDPQLQEKPVWDFLEKGFRDVVMVETPPSFYDPREEDGRPGRPRWTEGRVLPLWSGEDDFDELNGPIAFVILLQDVTRCINGRRQLMSVSTDLQDGLRNCARMKKSALREWARGAANAAPATISREGNTYHMRPMELVLSAPPPDVVLTAIEQGVLSLLAEGYAPKEIAAVQNKSEKTIYTQCKTASEKLGIRSLAQLTVYACRWYNEGEATREDLTAAAAAGSR